MTFQAQEILRYNGKKFTFDEHPLELYLKSNKIRIPYDIISSACCSGYIGHWKIKNDKLFLTNIKETSTAGYKMNSKIRVPNLGQIE